jgi:solute carrier family 44 (choline transporter-like protein), member 1
MIRVIMEYLIYQFEKANGEAKDNVIWNVAKCCMRCCVQCLDCCIKFINKNAYIQIALHNSNFCTAAKESFFLTVRNASRFSAVSITGMILTVLGKGSIVAICAFLTIALIDSQFPEISQPYLPAAIIAFFAYLISSMFLSIFRDSGLTILHCFCLDEEQGGGR